LNDGLVSVGIIVAAPWATNTVIAELAATRIIHETVVIEAVGIATWIIHDVAVVNTVSYTIRKRTVAVGAADAKAIIVHAVFGVAILGGVVVIVYGVVVGVAIAAV
jgi:hypothetical protein